MKNDNKMSMLPLSIWLSFTGVLKICMNKNYLEVENLKISNELLKFVNNELLNEDNRQTMCSNGNPLLTLKLGIYNSYVQDKSMPFLKQVVYYDGVKRTIFN